MVVDCSNSATHKGMCAKHYQRWCRHGDCSKTLYGPHGKGSMTTGGYIKIGINGIKKYEHIYLAEKALGRSLPSGAQVHHMNEVPWDNYTPCNLVICPDQEYHQLLHKRTREYNARHR